MLCIIETTTAGSIDGDKIESNIMADKNHCDEVDQIPLEQDDDVVKNDEKDSVILKNITTTSGKNNNNNIISSSNKIVSTMSNNIINNKKPNLDKVVEQINHKHRSRKMSDVDEKEMNGNHQINENSDEEMPEEDVEHEENEQSAAMAASIAAAQQIMGAGSFNPSMFPTAGGMSMQAFQNAVAQFTANAVANNMDMDNVTLLKSALFTLQQQQLLQFQLIQHLHSQLLRNNSGDRGSEDGNEPEKLNAESENESSNKKDEETALRRLASISKPPSNMYDTPLKRLEEQSARVELDLR